jgi:FkbM family methyltransferase
MFDVCRKNAEGIRNVEMIQTGLWSRKDKLYFNSMDTNPSAARIVNNGAESIDVVSIDEFLDGKKATLIKMDIEGAELEALKGAQKTIEKFRPKLAVCLYHKPEDILKIPHYILGLIPDYKLYIRHYSSTENENVLFAV